jgi:C1A family cysteine protease
MTVDVLLDLREVFGPARHQGSRPTCLAFALSDAHAAARGRYEALSVEHLYYHAVQRTPASNPDDGVAVTEATDALRLDGQCTEIGWPYRDPLPTDRSLWKPPATATPIYRRHASIADSLIMSVLGHLNAGTPVVLILLLGERFYRPVDAQVTPGPNDADVDYHAVIAVGLGKTAQGEQCVLVRNSWGPSWGLEGHAWITVPYLAQRLRGTLLMSPKVSTS